MPQTVKKGNVLMTWDAGKLETDSKIEAVVEDVQEIVQNIADNIGLTVNAGNIDLFSFSISHSSDRAM